MYTWNIKTVYIGTYDRLSVIKTLTNSMKINLS